MKQFFFSSFPREDLRKWLSYVCRSRDHSLSHEISLSHQTSSSSPALSLALLTAFHAHQNSALSVPFFLLLAFINQHTGTNTFFPVVVLFNCLCFTRLYFTAMPLAVEKMWLSNHLLQNLQTGLDHRSITSASTVAVVDVLEFCRHRHTLEGCRNCCCCCCRDLPVFFFLETHGITTPRGTHDFPSFLRGSHTVLVPWGHARDRSNSNSSSLWSLLVGRGFSPKNTDTAYRQIIKYNNKQQVYMITT